MFDMLPFPRITSRKPEEQVNELTQYLIQFKETLEFILTNISFDNLSQEMITRLNSLGAEIEKRDEKNNEQMQQVSHNAMSASYVFYINYNTGDLEYTRQ